MCFLKTFDRYDWLIGILSAISGMVNFVPIFFCIYFIHLSTMEFSILILTASRAPLIALVISAIITSVYLILKNKKIRLRFLTLGLGLILLSSLVLYFAWPQIKTLPLIERTSITIKNWQDGVVPDRISWAQSSVAMFMKQPIIGLGLSTFRDNYSQFRRTDYVVELCPPGFNQNPQLCPPDMQYLIIPEASHDELLNYLATQGAFGLITYLFLIFVAKKLIIGEMKTKQSANLIQSLILMNFIIVYLIQSLFSFNVISTAVAFYSFIGIISLLEKPIIKSYNLKNWFKYPLLILFLFLISSLSFYTLKEAQAEFEFKQAINNQNAGNFTMAEQNLLNAIILKPFEFSYPQALGDLKLKILTQNNSSKLKADLTDAISYYQQSIKLNQNYPSTWHNVALAYLNLYLVEDDPQLKAQYKKLTINALNKSTEISVNNALYTYEAGRIYKLLGELDLSKKAYQETQRINPNFRDTAKILEQF